MNDLCLTNHLRLTLHIVLVNDTERITLCKNVQIGQFLALETKLQLVREAALAHVSRGEDSRIDIASPS